jgi:hypothetical protein
MRCVQVGVIAHYAAVTAGRAANICRRRCLAATGKKLPRRRPDAAMAGGRWWHFSATNAKDIENIRN